LKSFVRLPERNAAPRGRSID